MTRLRILLAAGLCFLISAPADAARFSGDYLLQVCASDSAGKEVVAGGHIACQAYISGILDYHNLLKTMGAAQSVDFCVPASATLNTVQKQVFSHVYRNRQQHGQFIAAPGVALALFQHYPCR